MNPTADIRAVITAEDRASATVKKFGDNVSGTGSAIAGVAKIAAEALAAAGAAAIGFGAVSLKAYAESEAIGAQLNQVLLTTGKSATISSSYVDQLATTMERYSGKTKDSIVQGQVLLLQFSRVTKQNLPEMTKAMLDLSQRMGVDTVTAAKQLGIALDDPTAGMTRLKRSGIDFTEAQKETVKAMQKSGDIAGADAILMKALEEKVGGAAGAYRNTLPGAISSAKASLKDFEITVGGTIAQYLEPLATKAAAALSQIDWQKVVNNTVSVLKNFGQELDNTWHAIDKVYQQVANYLEPKLEALWKNIQTAFPVFRKFIDEYINPLVEVLAAAAGKSLVWALGLIIDTANALLKVITPIFSFLDANKPVVYGLAAAFTTLAGAMALGAAFDAMKVGFATLQLVTIPGVMAQMGALQTMLVGFTGWGIFGAAGVAAFVAIKVAGDQTKAAIDNLNKSIADATASEGDAIKKVEDAYKAGKISKDQEMKTINAITGKASGGAVNAGQPYIVGEEGQELFIPGQSGTIVNAKDTSNALGGSTQVNININAQAFMGSQIQARQHAMDVFKALQDYAASKNTSVAKLVAGA